MPRLKELKPHGSGSEYVQKLSEQVEATYGERALALLEKIRSLLNEGDFIADKPEPMHSDDYRWNMTVWRNEQHKLSQDQDNTIDVSIEIAEAMQYGELDSPCGINFGLELVEWGGRMLGGLVPYNYTENCWVDMRDKEAVEERFKILENADIDEISSLLSKA